MKVNNMLKISRLLVSLTTIVSCGYSSTPSDYLNNKLNNSINNNIIIGSNIENNINTNTINVPNIISNNNIFNNSFISNNIMTKSDKKLIGNKRKNINEKLAQIENNNQHTINNINNKKTLHNTLFSKVNKTLFNTKINNFKAKITKYDNSYEKFIEQVLLVFNDFRNIDVLLPGAITDYPYKSIKKRLKDMYKNIYIPLDSVVQFAELFDKFELGSENHKNIMKQYIESQKINSEFNGEISFQNFLEYISKHSSELLSETMKSIRSSIIHDSSEDKTNVDKINFEIVNKSIGILFELIDKLKQYTTFKLSSDKQLSYINEEDWNRLRNNLKKELNIMETYLNNKFNDIFQYCCEEEFNKKEFNKFSELHEKIVKNFTEIANTDSANTALAGPLSFNNTNYSDCIDELCKINNYYQLPGIYGEDRYGKNMLYVLEMFILYGYSGSSKNWKIKEYIEEHVVPVLNTLKDLIGNNTYNIIKDQHMISFNNTIGLYLNIAKGIATQINGAIQNKDLQVENMIEQFSNERKNRK